MRALFVVLSVCAAVALSRLVFRLRISWGGFSATVRLSVYALWGIISVDAVLSAALGADGLKYDLTLNGRQIGLKAVIEEFRGRREPAKALFRLPRGFVRRVAERLGKRVKAESITVHMVAGSEDAARTALICGMINASIMGACTAFGIIDGLYLKIAPKFGQSAFAGRVECIAGLSIWHIIEAAIHGLYLRKPRRAGRAAKSPQNT